MKMEAGLDTGAVYSSSSTKIESSDTAASLSTRLAELGAALLSRDLSQIAQGKIPATPQALDGVTYAKKITNDEAHIDWSLDAPRIARTIHGLNPAPGAFTLLRGLRLKVYAATAKGSEATNGKPGTISRLSNDMLEISCGSGVLALDEVQLEGKRRMPVAEFLRGGAISREDLLS